MNTIIYFLSILYHSPLPLGFVFSPRQENEPRGVLHSLKWSFFFRTRTLVTCRGTWLRGPVCEGDLLFLLLCRFCEIDKLYCADSRSPLREPWGTVWRTTFLFFESCQVPIKSRTTNFIAGARSLNEQDLNDNLTYFKVPQLGQTSSP